MVWAVFSSLDVGPIVKFYGRLNCRGHQQLVNENVLPHVKNQMPPESIFQQDHFPVYKVGKVLRYFEHNNMVVFAKPGFESDRELMKLCF